jgi:hypothetical protein
MVLMVHPSTIWRPAKTAIVAAAIAATSVVGLWANEEINFAVDFAEPDWVFVPIFFGLLVGYPVATVVVFFKRLPRARQGLLYAVSYGVGWHVTMSTIQIAQYGLWKGFRPEERTAANLIEEHITDLSISVAVAVTVLMTTWILCRLARGEPLIQDGTLCANCGYNLTGNVTGRCPECGEVI